MKSDLEKSILLMKNYKAKFIMIDGMDGAGKGYAADCIANYFEKRGFKVYDLRKLENAMDYIPEFEQIKTYDVLVFKEPTTWGVGKDLREEIFKQHRDRNYNVSTQAMAFSIQREILYKRLIIKALSKMDYVIAERGFITSLVFQPFYSKFKKEKPEFTIDKVLDLEGNKLAITYMPNYFLITDCSVKDAMLRLKSRDKKDNAIYETTEFQTILRDVYLGKEKLFVEGKHLTLKKFLESKGKIQETKYCMISTDGTQKDTKERIVKFLKSI
ncbi:MAG: hypothetical protein ACP5OZ_04780 [Candidatus Woesearchaeota archaeon]